MPVAASQGTFSAAFPWPIVAIHVALLPDGRVISYGTAEEDPTPRTLVYDLWTPALGQGASAHMLLPNQTGADTFCAGQTLLPGSTALIIANGNTAKATRRYGTRSIKSFDPANNQLSEQSENNVPRWYPTLLSLPDGRLVLLGGRQQQHVPAPVPELYSPGTGWALLPSAASSDAFGEADEAWSYPVAALAPDGSIIILGRTKAYRMTLGSALPGSAAITDTGVALPAGAVSLPLAMFSPGKILSLREDGAAIIADINQTPPVISRLPPLSQLRHWANATVIADGRVLISGGSSVANKLQGVAYNVEIFDPVTGHFTLGAPGSKPRLYHSTALLLPDASVLISGGGAPGPVRNLNAEIYYPPYLYSASGAPAARPVISAASTVAAVGGSISASMADTQPVSRLTLVRFGSATHARNFDQRFFNLAYTQSGNQLSAQLPGNANVLLPGFYMLFAFNAAGTPSLAATLRVTLN